MIEALQPRTYKTTMNVIVDAFYKWYRNKVSNPKYRWLIIGGTLLYLFSPFDISPDFFPIIGWIDDGAVLVLLTTELTRLLMEYRKDRKDNNINPPQEEIVDVEATIS
jgi:uncharacterized membrane protein YkvA (DUF1232 family)